MAYPAGVGAFTNVTTYNGSYPIAYRRIQRYWQTRPYDFPMPYDSYRGVAAMSQYSGGFLGSATENAQSICSVYYDATRMANVAAKAYDKLKGRIYDQAALGVDFAEFRQSLGMVSQSLGTLYKFTRKVRRLDFVGAARELRMKIQPKGVKARRSWANNWLEYHFGWEPLIKDIYDAIEVLNNPLKSFTITRGRSLDYNVFTVTSHPGSGSVWKDDKYYQYYQVQQGARVEALTNRGLHALDQFGLANPAVIMWELIPFSFVVDWVANVGNVLASFSDYAGMTLSDTYTSRKFIQQNIGLNYYSPNYNGVKDLSPLHWYAFGVHFWRSEGLTAPEFSVKKLRLPSSTRALTAASLLSQILK